jgi:NDP-sugar pyrophosphorylase family protein
LYNITQLVQRLVTEGQKVASFPIREYWLDIGQMPDYRRAQEDVMNGRLDN